MKCIVCDVDFEAKRADAKFCSSTCRSKASRGLLESEEEEMVEPVEKVEVESGSEIVDRIDESAPLVWDEHIRSLTPYGQERKVWDKENPIENLRGGYFHIGQTQEEYIENIKE